MQLADTYLIEEHTQFVTKCLEYTVPCLLKGYVMKQCREEKKDLCVCVTVTSMCVPQTNMLLRM